MCMRIPSPLILLSTSFFEEAADERAHHSHQNPIKCIKGNVFGFMVCFEGTSGKMRWERQPSWVSCISSIRNVASEVIKMQVFERMHKGTSLRCTLAQLLSFCCTPGIAAICPKLPLPLKPSSSLTGTKVEMQQHSKTSLWINFLFKISSPY